MDLPVMTAYQSDFVMGSINTTNNSEDVVNIEQLIAQIKVEKYSICLENAVVLSDDCTAYQLRLANTRSLQTTFPELENAVISFVSEPVENHFLHRFFAALLTASDEYISEIFSFDGFKRFSKRVNIKQVAEFSYQTRNIDIQDIRFKAHFKDMSYHVDASKAPIINTGDLGVMQRKKITQYSNLLGYLPEGL